MTVMSIEEFESTLDGQIIDEFFALPDFQPPFDGRDVLSIPQDSGAKVALATRIGNSLDPWGPAILWIRQTGIWPSSEHLDLFYGYRKSKQEFRSVQEAPIHRIEVAEKQELISLICLSLFFVWDVEIILESRAALITISHDEWISFCSRKGQGKLGKSLQTGISLSR